MTKNSTKPSVPPPSVNPPAKMSGAKGCLWAIGILALLFLVIVSSVVMLWALRESGDRKELEAKLAELSARGAPIDKTSLNAWYQSATDPSDATAWSKIFAEINSEEFKEWSRGVALLDANAGETEWTEQGWPGEEAERGLVAKTESLRQRIRELTNKPAAIRLLGEIDSIITRMDHVQHLREVQRLLSTEFRVAFVDRDSARCRESIETALSLSSLCRKDPYLINHLVNIALHGIALHNIREAVEYDVLTQEDLAALLQRLSDEELSLQRLSWMIQGERAGALAAFREPEKLGEQGTELLKLTGITNRSQLNYIGISERYENLDVSDIDTLKAAARAETNAMDAAIKNAGALGFPDWMAVQLTLPAIEAVIDAMIRDAVQQRFVRHAIALRLIEKKTGQFPADLEALKSVGLDPEQSKPWGGQPFGYRVDEEGPVLWATIPQDGSATSEDPPVIDEELTGDNLKRMFFLRFKKLGAE